MPITVFFYSLEFKYRYAEYFLTSTRIASIKSKINFTQIVLHHYSWQYLCNKIKVK